MNQDRYRMALALVILMVAAPVFAVGWEPGSQGSGYFTLGQVNGREIFIDPAGKPFYAKGMVYAYGPEKPGLNITVDEAKVIRDLELMKAHGFNTVNLYGDMFLDALLAWCDRNEMAVYFRTKYAPEDFPDFLDPALFKRVTAYYDEFLKKVGDHPCVQAIDMDQRWLLADADWSSRIRGKHLILGPETVRRFPAWLQRTYGDVAALNTAWKKNYGSFTEVLNDQAIIEKGQLKPLGRDPWRLDLAQYSFDAANEFLKNLRAYFKQAAPHYLVTYTTELPEAFLCPVSTRENSGMDFISPVHYNNDAHYNRDWIGACKIILQGKFHHDLNNMTVYISETGFRTDPLSQTPPALMYAYGRPGDKSLQAEMYLREMLLLNTLPFMSGWGYFKLYDKWFEGDFGYLNDDMSDKPMSALGKVLNPKLPVNLKPEAAPRAWLYYPDYAFGSDLAGFMQHQTLVTLLEHRFLSRFEQVVQTIIPHLSDPQASDVDAAELQSLVDDFDSLWTPFKFTQTMPDDDKPVILAGRVLEGLSLKDREILKNKRTIIFAPVGLRDERYNETSDWYLEVAGIQPEAFNEKYVPFKILTASKSAASRTISCDERNVSFTLSRKADGRLRYIPAKAGRINVKKKSYYTNIHLLLAATRGDACEAVTLVYRDGTTEKRYLGPTIPCWWTKPRYGHLGLTEKINNQDVYLTHLEIPCDASRKLDAIILPDNPEVRIFAITASRFGITRDAYATVQAGAAAFRGRCPWILQIDPSVAITGNVLARFSNGSPAIVQSADGRHTVFLYDGLTWEGKSDEMSRNVEAQAAILEELLK